MYINDMSDILFSVWKNNNKQSIMLLGPPGIGKTSVAAAVAERIKEHCDKEGESGKVICHIKDLSSSLPEDLNGLPKTDGSVMRFLPDTWLAECCEPGAKGILILDDLPAASAAIQVAARQLVLDRRIHEHKLAPGVLVVVTGNRREDASAAKTLPAHFRNSVLMLDVEADFKSWCTWMRTNGGDRVICDFLEFRPNFFSRLPSNSDERGCFATPRTWKMLSDLMTVANETNKMFDIAAGLVGNGVASEFVAFCEMTKTVADPKKVLENPAAHYPPSHEIWHNRPDMMIAVLSSISYHSAKQKKTKEKNPVEDYVRAVAFFCEKNTEFTEFALSCYKDSGGKDMNFFIAAQELSKTEERVKNLRARLREVFA